MQMFRFRNFVIYKEAREFRKIVRREILSFPKEEQFRLVDQIHRSSLSIILNIAEGSAKGADKDFARFLTISLGSLSEVIAGFDVALDDGIIHEEQRLRIESAGERLGRQIGSFIQRLRSPRSSP